MNTEHRTVGSELSELKAKADRLSSLLAQPEPGLMTWGDFYKKSLLAITDHIPTDVLREVIRRREEGQ